MSAELQHLLMRDAIVVKQEVELANVIIGFDAANRYSLSDPSGEFLGSAAEQGGGVGGSPPPPSTFEERPAMGEPCLQSPRFSPTAHDARDHVSSLKPSRSAARLQRSAKERVGTPTLPRYLR